MSGLWTLEQACQAMGGRLLGDGSVVPTALSMDTRTLPPGSCFVAIRGQRDGHDFAAQAVAAGAAAVLADHDLGLDAPQVLVGDTLAGLQRWGQARLEACRPPHVFAVTGSVGKTSTKDLLAAATSGWKTPGNRNNTLGLPEALATLPEGLEAVVLEMGMSTPGEIRRLAEIASPDLGIVTNIGQAHMENFPDGQEGIARAKGELVAGLKPGGAWVHLADDAWCHWVAIQPWARARAVPVGPSCAFGWEDEMSLGLLGERFVLRHPGGGTPVSLRLRGAHQVRNAALAATAAILAGYDPAVVARRLGEVDAGPGRGRLHPLPGGGWLLDESYNAIKESILACAESLLSLEGGEAVAVLGCMRELGAGADRVHRETGAGLRDLGVRRVLVYGDHAASLAAAFGPGAEAFPDFEALRDDPGGLTSIPSGARVLVKGSRFWRTERAVEFLLNPHTLGTP
jgi:UDP-N-acetylmuramoyl-tripeptide--D-alanyl-D-alanine ligase